MISNDIAIRKSIFFKRGNSLTLSFQLHDEEGVVIPLAGIAWRLEVWDKRESSVVDTPIPSGLDTASIDLLQKLQNLSPGTYHHKVSITKSASHAAILEGDLIVVDSDVTSIPTAMDTEITMNFTEDIQINLQAQGIYATSTAMNWSSFNL